MIGVIPGPAVLRFDVATTAFQPSRDLQASIIEGHMQKLGGSSSVFIRRWKKRYFILRQDSCLYYYKHKSVGALCVCVWGGDEGWWVECVGAVCGCTYV